MNERITKLQGFLNKAHEDIQNIVVQTTASNIRCIQSALNSIQYVYNELEKVKDELQKESVRNE